MQLMTTAAAASLTALVSSLALGQAEPSFTADEISNLCVNQNTLIGAVTTQYTYKNWEGIPQTPSVTFEPKGDTCVTNQTEWRFTFQKTNPHAPPFFLELKFAGIGASFSLKEWPKTDTCNGVVSDWFIAYWVNRGAILSQSTRDAMQKSVRSAGCPALVDAATKAILAKMAQR